MDSQFFEELIRAEVERLAQETSSVDFCELAPEDRYCLRLLAIDNLELGTGNFEAVWPTITIDAA